MKSPVMEMFLERFKSAAAEGAAVELKLRVLAGKVPAASEQGLMTIFTAGAADEKNSRDTYSYDPT